MHHGATFFHISERTVRPGLDPRQLHHGATSSPETILPPPAFPCQPPAALWLLLWALGPGLWAFSGWGLSWFSRPFYTRDPSVLELGSKSTRRVESQTCASELDRSRSSCASTCLQVRGLLFRGPGQSATPPGERGSRRKGGVCGAMEPPARQLMLPGTPSVEGTPRARLWRQADLDPPTSSTHSALCMAHTLPDGSSPFSGFSLHGYW